MAKPKKPDSSDDNKSAVVARALSDLKKQMGEDIVFMGDDNPIKIDAISTGSIGVDHAIGIGGVPRGRITEIYGPESSGKTTLTLSIVAEAQKRGGICAFIDTEHALDPTWAERIGVDLSKLAIAQPNSGEDAFEVIGRLLRTSAFDVIVLDSVAALAPRAEIDGDVGDSHVALQARLMSQSLRRLTAVIKQTNTVLLFTNQLRATIGGFGFGPSETTPGGKALKYHASVRIDIRGIQSIKEKNEVVGRRTKVRVKKNKVAPPFRECEFDIMVLENGISRLGEILDYGVKMDIIDKRGAFYRYGETLLGQGKSAAREYLAANPEFTMGVENSIRQEMGLPVIEDVPNYGLIANIENNDTNVVENKEVDEEINEE